RPLMSLDFLIDRFDELAATRALAAGLPGPGTRVPVSGLPGSSSALLVATLARRLSQRVFVVVTATPTDAERWLADARALAGDVAALYPQREALGAEEPHLEIAGERIETVESLLSARVRILVTTARATAERTGVPGALHAAPLQRQPLLDLLPTDALLVLEQDSALAQEVDRAWADAAHHLEIARRLGEEPPARDELFLAPERWHRGLAAFARLVLNAPDAAARFPVGPPEPVDRDIKRLRRLVAGGPPTVILCDNEGQLERLE